MRFLCELGFHCYHRGESFDYTGNRKGHGKEVVEKLLVIPYTCCFCPANKQRVFKSS